MDAWPSIEVSPDADLPAIAAAAGSAEGDGRLFQAGRLYVRGVTQEALEAAAARVGSAPAKLAAITLKADVWRRATDDEAAKMRGMLDEAPPKMAGLWADSTALHHDSAEWPMLLTSFVEAFGEPRAAQLLAPS